MVNAIWSGSYPCLCMGEWTLEVNEKDVSDMIPEHLRNSPMNTFGKYNTWEFGRDYEEKWSTYKDGLKERIWIRENEDWLKTITEDPDLLKEIFKAFQKEDWRHNSCGGCI